MSSILPAYAELHCLSNFSFLRGASHPDELVKRAHAMGYHALAITDECSLAGVVRAHVEAKALGMKLLIGSEFMVEAAHRFKLIVLATNREGYGNLSAFISRLRRSSPKGSYRLTWRELDAHWLDDCLVLLVPERGTPWHALFAQAQWLTRTFADRAWLGISQLHALDDAAWLYKLQDISRATTARLVACGDVHMHVRSRKPLQDVLTAIRLGLPLTECGMGLQANAERHLRSRVRLAQLYPGELLAATAQIADRCTFSLDELKYEYPDEVVPPGHTPSSYLRQLAYQGALRRFPHGTPIKVLDQIEYELRLIDELQYAHYFLTVYDIVRFARSENILCQGRGSAANSTVCYCLGITEIDPARTVLLFERFVSRERNEPPDIDVDFEHQRREEVMQYIYGKYGRERAALTATVICYRPRSAIRDVGKALGFDLQTIERVAKSRQWWDGHETLGQRLVEVGLAKDDVGARLWIELSGELLGFPRHLSQHTGGFVMSRGPLTRMVPVENAAMPDRTVIQWDKDDLDAVGLLKVDVLALGMLSALRRALAFIGQRRGHAFALQDIPDKDHATFDMICRADTIGVFQIESRAQQSMLPRLQPRKFYDLVIEVAIVRPGPIQGGMVHPYLRRRQDPSQVTYPSEALKEALSRTLGIPIFQEQVMQVAMLAAGFSAGEADQLRRAMAAWKRKGGIGKFQERIVEGMTSRGYDPTFAEDICRQIQGFGEYGFPESHAASFALLVYDSSWIKCHEPAAFLAALLNSQPLGFYTPSQLVQDARRHGVTVLPVDVVHSDVQARLDHEGVPATEQPPVRLGLCMVSGLSSEALKRIVDARAERPFDSAQDLAMRAQLDDRGMTLLAKADALRSLTGHRRQQVWEALALQAAPVLLKDALIAEPSLILPEAPEGQEIESDYLAMGLSLRRHPLALLRPHLAEHRMLSSAQLQALPNRRLARTCGIVTVRQRPGTAKGVVFVSLEDEEGAVQVVVWPAVRERFRSALLSSRLLAVFGVWQRGDGGVCNLIAHRLENWSPLLGQIALPSRDFH
jgi:error-prone DNA polymerase